MKSQAQSISITSAPYSQLMTSLQQQENQVHQRIADLRKEGLWSLRRLPKLQEAARPKSHQDFLLEEMQWMATDFVQERRWKTATAKKLIRNVVRYHEDKRLHKERSKKAEQNRLRRLAASTAREIEHFWSSIKQVVEIKLQVEEERMKKTSNVQEISKRGQDTRIQDSAISGRKRKATTLLTDHEEIDEENAEVRNSEKENMGHQIELTDLAQEMEDSVSERASPLKEVVFIESLLRIDQHEGTEKTSAAMKHMRDIVEVAAAAEVLLPKDSAQITTAVEGDTPSLLYGTLRAYQKIGLDWLVKLYKKNLNGILGDEAGLGKTTQVIAFFTHLACNEGNWGPHLVVVQSRNILKWEIELKHWCPELKRLCIGSQRELIENKQELMKPNSFNVCITSYKQLFKGHQTLRKMRWRYLVVDDMQKIKNLTEKHWEALFHLQSQHRLLLIDTPLPNALRELWTMLHFLIPGISIPYLDFLVKAANEGTQDYCHKVATRLHKIVQPFILRRSKRHVEKQLPKKYEYVLKCHLSNRQKAMYEDVLLQPRIQETLENGNFVSVLHVLMQLQRICNHPDLIKPRLSGSSYVSETLEYTAASLVLKVLERDLWKDSDTCLFDLIGVESKMTDYEAQVLPKQKVTRKLIEEIYSSPHPSPRPNPMKLKPSRLFQPVEYGQKPEGRIVDFPTPPSWRTGNIVTVMATHHGKRQGRLPLATFSANCNKKGDKIVKLSQLASTAGAQGKTIQPNMPVTLQFKGKTFTLSYGQLCQLTGGRLQQLQGSVLHIVSVPGLRDLQSQWPVALLPLYRAGAGTVQDTGFPKHLKHQADVPTSTLVTQQITNLAVDDPETESKSVSTLECPTQTAFEDRNRHLKERLDRIFSGNERRCSRVPLYGRDLLGICSLIGEKKIPQQSSTRDNKWMWAGFVNCCLSSSASRGQNDPLQTLILTSDQRQESLKDYINSTLCVLPAAVAAPAYLRVGNPPPSYRHGMKIFKQNLKEQAAPYLHHLQQITTPRLLQFPDRRLVQFDSGKLEALAVLLQKLKSKGHRALILTQMILMLDILELFLNVRFLTYIRIDENVNCEQYLELIKRFNRDKRIFCAILSSHSPSMSGSHIEANTVVFCDTDLDPLMHAKAQEWCDTIGRNKDIHIYRLVSGNSVEEMLLKNGTKCLIKEVATQANNYPMTFLTQQTAQELCEVHSSLEDLDFRVKAGEFVVLSEKPSLAETISSKVARLFAEALSVEQRKEDLGKYAQEARIESRTEVTSELRCPRSIKAPSQLKELDDIMDLLTPIEKYALNYLELFHDYNDQGKQKVNEESKTANREWEVNHIKKLKEKEDKMQWEEEEELLTYTRQDAYNMEYVYEDPDGQIERMPIWTPLTLLPDHNNVYIDSVTCLMYDSTPISESKLPPLYARKESRRNKHRHGEVAVPQSLFHRATPRMLKMRRKGNKQKTILLKQQTYFAKPLPAVVKPAAEAGRAAAGQDNPEWLISEDWALLQAVKTQLLERPSNLAIMSPVHTPNWDLVSDLVNSYNQVYRSPKHCQNRYENVVIPREEGKNISSHPVCTRQIYAEDQNAAHTQLYMSRFDLMKKIARKRSPSVKPLRNNDDKPSSRIQAAFCCTVSMSKEQKASGGTSTAQVVLGQQQTAAVPTAPRELVTVISTQGSQAGMSVAESSILTTGLTTWQTQTPLMAQVMSAKPTGVQLSSKTVTPVHFQLPGQQETEAVEVQVPRIQSQLQAQGQIQVQIPQAAQVPQENLPVVSVPPPIVPFAGVETLPFTEISVTEISVATGYPPKAAGAQTLDVHVHQFPKLTHQETQQQSHSFPDCSRPSSCVEKVQAQSQTAAVSQSSPAGHHA
ncbi:E1A-binding protein p400-like [Mauremys mutica]|uniref:E1A-binding protein p400-like n=1 Tax=Mauremys mutica TaxID=74926 RepID=UPI001D16198D|nr:E1A-binding protein p400-like [Mauremys mutica]